ncbi:NADPH-dependent F420 reductase [Stigmatella sp. ncwal1]|uniref:NADPH-dependent F420 reductase n=1 Tax=Stigmatella ashevillensis TaxID=2995309 RepID=A0ABT5DEM8_9BACT|nr:NADPH-dependent F420 reductase [Stigmatella ashevillena]MDC0711258.1 NADPH-dependent F420 reductase [Stigmatella ashevillena]
MSHSRRSVLGAFAALASLPALGQVKGKVQPSMRIGIIGAGWLGGTVGQVWVRAGHEVLFSSRHPEQLVSMTRKLSPRASVGTPRQAAEFGPVVLIAVPYGALPQIGLDLQEPLRGKIVLDACNPSSDRDDALAREAQANGVGPTSVKYLPGTRLVRAFSAVDATAIEASADRQSGKLAVPIAGDDTHAVQVAAQLVREAGCEPLVVGNLATATRFQRGGPGFRANTTMTELRRRLGLPRDTQEKP